MKKTIVHGAGYSALASYVTGFVLSLILTVIPYLLVTRVLLEGGMLVAALFTFALMQLLVQMVFFMHLGRESKPRWNLMVLLFTVLIVAIVVVGSLWIMNNLAYNMMPSDRQSQPPVDLKEQKGF